MRRQYFLWSFLVAAIIFTMYGGYSIIYSSAHNKDIPVLGLIMAIVGGIMLLIFVVLLIISLIQKMKKQPERVVIKSEEKDETPKQDKEEESDPENESEEDESDAEPVPKPNSYPRKDVVYETRGTEPRRFEGGSGYVKKVGYGSILRITNEEIVDMWSNTYYRIEGNIVNQLGSGPVFEINGNKIKLAFGSYLYEISGSNINKVFGGYYASINSGYIQTYDLQEKYELTDDFNLKQKLAIVALLFGTY